MVVEKHVFITHVIDNKKAPVGALKEEWFLFNYSIRVVLSIFVAISTPNSLANSLHESCLTS